MVATDVRTPPKVKTQVSNAELVSLGKGEAVPLDSDNIHSYEVMADTQFVKPATTVQSTPTSGISTWVLLNGGEQSTLATQKKPTKPLQAVATQTPSKKKIPKPTIQDVTNTTMDSVNNSTGIKLENRQSAFITKVENPKKTQQSVNQEPLVKIPALMLQDAKFKNKTPVVVGKVPSSASSKNKSETVTTIKKGNATITPVTVEKVEAPPTIRRKVSTTSPVVPTFPTATPEKTALQYELVPTTSVVVHTDIVETEAIEETATTETPTTTTKRTRKPGTKKKKKNKNRRRRPVKKPDGVVESKVTEEGNSTRIGPNGSRPLSTRIYNYLSREIMPSVGVGIVGLMLTAGLAGLFLYPFGGGIAARRTYEKVSAPSTDGGHMYYYNDYSSNGEVDNGQPEESVFGQVLAGMQQSESKYDKYPRPSAAQTHYSTQNKYRYDSSHEYGFQPGASYPNKDKLSSVNDAAARNPEGYSTLPDSTKYSSYNSGQYSPSSSSLVTQYGETKYPSLSASSSTGFSDSIETTGGVQYDSTKYSSSIDTTANTDSGSKYSTLTGLSVEPQSSKYSTGEQAVKYSPSTKYTSLTDDQANKYYQNPQYTSLTEGKNEKYTSVVDSASPKLTSMTDGKKNKYGIVSDDPSNKYPTSAQYTAYSNPSDIGTQSGTYSNHKQAVYTDIEYDDTKSLPSLTEEDKSDKSQPSFSALHASDNFLAADSMTMFSGSNSNEVKHRQGVLSVEHGPRNMKINRQKRQVNQDLNEVDGSFLEDQTTTEKSETTTGDSTTREEPKGSSPFHESTVESTTWSVPKEPEFTTAIPPSRDHGFFGFLGRLVQMKLRIGLELLRSTTHAMARYLDDVQKKMETVVKNMDGQHSRQRRDIIKFVS